jgi:hypothetical protein
VCVIASGVNAKCVECEVTRGHQMSHAQPCENLKATGRLP